MQLKVKTSTFQDAISKALKGAVTNKLFPITTLIGIKYQDNVLDLITTDYTNYFKVSVKDDVNGDDCFNLTVSIDKFTKLILKTTTEMITLELNDSNLKVIGNGAYDIELPLDEDGNPISFPYPKITTKFIESFNLPALTARRIINTNEFALATTFEDMSVINYYLDKDMTVSTDAYVVAIQNNGYVKSPTLISPILMDKLELINDQDIEIEIYEDNYIKINHENMEIIGRTSNEELNNYPISDVIAFGSLDFENNCKISRTAILGIIDRLSIFVEPYDENGMYLNFDTTGLTLYNKKSNASEKINYLEYNKENKVFTCLIDLTRLKEALESLTEDCVEVWYGTDQAIKLVSGKVSEIIALLGE